MKSKEDPCSDFVFEHFVNIIVERWGINAADQDRDPD
ncbi:MAG: hypothetical protein K0R93_360 [Anaerosolibacter sp.]|jgi:hypothetical protein|nr:hypothetical protein [Anaerosolibacter sp.]